MRLVQSFYEAAGPDDMAKSVLAALEKNDFNTAIPLACFAAQNCAPNCFYELNSLCAATLARGGKAEAALGYWDKIIRSAPHKLEYLEAGLATAWACDPEISENYEKRWLELFGKIYSRMPNIAFLANLTARGWKGSGSIGIKAGRVLGWVWMSVAKRPQLIFECERQFTVDIQLDVAGRANGNILYRLDAELPAPALTYKINLLAEGHVEGSPLIVSPSHLPSRKSATNELAIIIPVYDDYEATLKCLGTVFASLRKNRVTPRILVVWDKGPEEKLVSVLRKLANRKKIELYENKYNLGFLGSVNFALAQTSGDVILLNSDTIVNGDWLDRLTEASKEEDVATITALGNEAELMSFPSFRDRGKIGKLSEIKMLDSAAAKLARSEALLEIPVGVGFCMYITRRALNRIGGLDGKFLFRGYGEEVEYCLRAAEAGLKNYGAFNVFVGHIGERSFGIGKKALAAQNNEAIFTKFPEHRREYEVFLASSEPRALREKISREIVSNMELDVPLELRPWSNRFLPPWIRDEKYEDYERKGGALFIQPGRNARALLRINDAVPLADMRFDLAKDAGILQELLGHLSDAKGCIAYTPSQEIRIIARQLGLKLAEPENIDEIPVCPAILPHSVLAAPPENMGDWKLLLNLAKTNPSSAIYIFQLGTVWGEIPRPVNLHELPLMEDYRPLEPEIFICANPWDSKSWQRWLASHCIRDLPFCRLKPSV